MQPVEGLPEAKRGQSILIIEQDGSGVSAELYSYAKGCNPKAKGWKADPFTLFHSIRGAQDKRILGWIWVTQ